MAFTKNCSTGSEGAGSARALVLIDGDCLFCNKVARFVIRHDPKGRFCFAELGSGVAVRELGLRGVSDPPPEGTIVLVCDGKVFFRSEAALRLLGGLTFPWKLAGWLLAIPRVLRDPFYLLIARRRHRLGGRAGSCDIFSGAERSRFLRE